MKLCVNFKYSRINYFLIVLLWSLLQGCNAKSLATSSVLLADSAPALNSHAGNVQNSTGNVQNNTMWKNAPTVSDFKHFQHSNETAVTTMPAPTQSLESSRATSTSVVVKHIQRKKRETEMVMPFDFDTLHLPCDLDHLGRGVIVEYFPNHCIWVWNNKYAHEGSFRAYKLYQLEGFFFGQYYERLKRFEVDIHTWDYTDTGI